MKPDLMAALETTQPKPAPAPARRAAAAAPQQVEPVARRAELANVSAYLPKQFQTNLRILKATHDLEARAGLAEALNMLFVKHKLPQVPFDPKADS